MAYRQLVRLQLAYPIVRNLTIYYLVFVMYDWIVTLPREVQLFWTGKARSLSAILYFSTKYFNVLYQMLSLLVFIPSSDEVRTDSPCLHWL